MVGKQLHVFANQTILLAENEKNSVEVAFYQNIPKAFDRQRVKVSILSTRMIEKTNTSCKLFLNGAVALFENSMEHVLSKIKIEAEAA